MNEYAPSKCHCGHHLVDHGFHGVLSQYQHCSCRRIDESRAESDVSHLRALAKVRDEIKADLLHRLVPVMFTNGYPIRAVPQAVILDYFAAAALVVGDET